jgi:hypothetical protein
MLASAPWSSAWRPKVHHCHFHFHCRTGLLIGPLIITIIIFRPSEASSKATEVVGAGLTAVEVVASSVLAVF